MRRRQHRTLESWFKNAIVFCAAAAAVYSFMSDGLKTLPALFAISSILFIITIAKLIRQIYLRLRSSNWRWKLPTGPNNPPGSLWTEDPHNSIQQRLVGYLLTKALQKLPEIFRDRFAEEWHDHRTRKSGTNLVWWALWVRITARRTATALLRPFEISPRQLTDDTDDTSLNSLDSHISYKLYQFVTLVENYLHR